jgi:hypothetical protein
MMNNDRVIADAVNEENEVQENLEEMREEGVAALRQIQDMFLQNPELSTLSIVNNLLYHVNTKMLLSPTEHQRAHAMKRAVLSEEDLNPQRDFSYVQLALVDIDDTATALERVRHMQVFLEEYGINDTFEQGMALCRIFIDQHPGCLMSVAYNALDGNYCSITDQRAFDQDLLQLPEDWKNFFGKITL